jgi:hypothetical protein
MVLMHEQSITLCRHSTIGEAFMAVGLLADDRGRYDKGVRVFRATVDDYLKWGKGAYASGRLLGECSETMRCVS